MVRHFGGYKMIRSSKVCFFLLVLGFVSIFTTAFADIDTVDYNVYVKPNFTLKNNSYQVFQTPQYDFDKPMDNIIISVDSTKSKTATVKSYVRVKFEDSGIWSQLKEFDTEFHYSNIRTLTGYQLFFAVRDSSKGKTTIDRFTVQAKYLGKQKMTKILAPDSHKFKATKTFPKPAIVSRAAWGAEKPKGAYTPHTPLRIIMHHSYIPTQAQYRGASTIRGIQQYHMHDPKTGWNDIGYHFLIGPEGIIYQGRPETVVGAHCSPNTNAVGVCVIGDYDPDHDNLNPKIQKSIVNLLSWLCSKYNINPMTKLYGHRDFSPKSCPGDKVYDDFSYYQKQVLSNIK